MSESGHDNSANKWLTFFMVCFALTMAIGIWAIFTYNVNAPEAKPSGGGHGYIIPAKPDTLIS